MQSIDAVFAICEYAIAQFYVTLILRTEQRVNTVQQLSSHEILEQAKFAATHQDWGQLSQNLQQILSTETQSELFCDPNTTVILLDLAMQVLESGGFQDRWDVAKLFPNFGSDAIAPLIELLNDEDAEPESQWFAVRILGSFNHPQVIEALIELLKHSESEDLNSMAVSVLASMGKDAISMIETLLAEDSTRLFAVQALGQIRRSETIPLLMQVVRDPEVQIRAIAVETLSSFHSDDITTVLIGALQDVAVQVRLAAVTGLGFRSDSPDLVGQLRPLLFDLNLDVCRQTAIALGRLGTSQAATALYEVLQSAHTPENLSIELVRALGWIALPEALNYLKSALLELSETVQLEVIQTLGRTDAVELKSQAAEILLDALPKLESIELRQAIALSLGQLGNLESINVLVALLADRDDGVRFHAISALKTLDAELSHQQLEKLAKIEPEDSELGRGIAIALREWNF
ncbi:HEAT repeat domain-containing protein [Leptolyngbya sp. AN03gr2]|uniref:HEAT repeat domain-containing protein n=1 Tax=unclassified Leptolyngbya TaxID=2650499 RepID=UPI003D319709